MVSDMLYDWQALTKRTSDGGRTQPASTSAASAFETFQHHMTTTAASDKQKDGGSSSVSASTIAATKEMDTVTAAGHVSEQLVKQVEVSCRLISVTCCFSVVR